MKKYQVSKLSFFYSVEYEPTRFIRDLEWASDVSIGESLSHLRLHKKPLPKFLFHSHFFRGGGAISHILPSYHLITIFICLIHPQWVSMARGTRPILQACIRQHSGGLYRRLLNCKLQIVQSQCGSSTGRG